MIKTPAAIYHDTPSLAPHRCEPRISATCAICEREYVLCTIGERGVREIVARVWACSACRADGGLS